MIFASGFLISPRQFDLFLTLPLDKLLQACGQHERGSAELDDLQFLPGHET